MKANILLLFMLVLFGCKTTNKLEKQVETKNKTETAISENVTGAGQTVEQNSSNKSIDEIERMTDEFIAKITVYDTAQPAIDSTGKRPVSSEMIITNIRNFDKVSKLIDSSQKNLDQVHFDNADYKSDIVIKNDSTENVQTENVKSGTGIYVMIVLIVVVLSILILLLKKPFSKLHLF